MAHSLSDAVAFVADVVHRLDLNGDTSRVSQFYTVLHNADGTSRGLIKPDDPDFEIACEALRDVTQLEFFFDQVDIAAESQEIKSKVRLVVKDPVLPQQGKAESPGRDAQAELFVFAACRKAGLKPLFQEPDIVCMLDNQTMPIAVKRVKNPKQLVKRIKEGTRQVVQAGGYGIIFVDVVLAMNPKNHRVIAEMPDADFGRSWAELMKQLVHKYHADIQRAIRGNHILGVILHDHWICMDLHRRWGLKTMTYGVPIQPSTSSLAVRFATFMQTYISALPTLTRLTGIQD